MAAGLLDELIELEVPAAAGLRTITRRAEPATEQELTAALAGDTWPPPLSVLDWQEQALCKQTDPETFFPEKGGSAREAKRTCMACPVRAACLAYALATDERFGIWGGLSERERRRVKKGTLDAAAPVRLPVRPRREPAAPVPAPDVVEEAAVWAPAEPVLCAAPGCTQLVTVEFIRRTGQRIHPPCLARLAGASSPALVGSGR